MRTVFVCLLLCSFVVGIASKVPRLPECPTLPRLQRCRAGIADQCTKDLDCPPFTRCCSDGCTRRCVDTLSKLITYRMRTKYGACARPPLNKCTAKADLCYDDSYCLGDEKCCIDTDCGKKCLLPEVLQLVKNSTKAFKCLHVKSDGKKCPRDPNHQCSVDSECPTYTTCCFDGCRKRCTDRHGKIVSNIQGYLCPILPQPATCTNPFQECQVDKDCTMSMKCCSDACNYWCMPSYPPPAKTIFTYTEPVPTERNLRKLHKPGNCPVLQKPKSCNDEVIQCNYDVDCWNSDKKCCDNGCVNVCVDPASTSSFVHLLTDKITKQPTTKPPTTTKTTTLPPRTQESSSSKQPLTKKKTLPSTRKSIPTTFTSRPETTTTRVSTGRSTTERKTTKAMTKSTYAPAIPTRDTKVVILNREGVVVYPESTEATAGQNIVVTCSIKGEPFEGWYTPKGLKITSEQDNSIFVRGRGHDYTLVINQVEQMHGGKYTCRGAFSSATYELYIKLHIDTPANKQFLRAGSTGIVEVAAKGYPRPQATWMKDHLPIRLTSGRYAVSPSGSLIIKGVQLSDKGHYSIIANHFYRKSNPGLYSAMVGSSDSADITVDVIKGNQENNYCPYLIPPSNCSSIIKECTSDNQCSGNKKCCSDSCRFKCVNSQASNSEIIPGVQVYPGSKSFCNPTQTIRLVCRVDKQPFEGWFDSYNRKVTTSTHGSRMMVEDHSEYQVLVIKNVTARDGGMYTCQGALDSATIHVSVNQTIDKYEHPIMLYPGQAGLLLQNIQCYPPPRFIWYKRGKPLDLSSDRYSVSPSGSLGIRRIRSTDMGVYTLKLQMSDEIKDTGVKVAAAVDGVDFTEWQDSLVPGASVRCHKEAMYIDIEKKVLKEYNDADLSLRNSSCRASSNETHYTLRASLVGCGTVAQFTKEAVVYSNIVQQYRSRDMISRLEDIKIPFSCFYTKEGVTSTFGLLPSKVRRVFDGGNVTTKFELGMSLYRDSSYSLSFGVADFPLRVTVNRPLFVQVKIDSPDRRLTVMADRCYATPTQDPRHPMQYDIIKDGCPVDPTVVFYKGPHTIQRFSFKAFKFLAKGKIFVYLHCHLIVCNVTDPTSRCAIGCLSSSFGRFRRDASPSAEAELTQGPFLLEKKPAALPLESGSSFKQYIWIMVGMVGFCILCLIAMVYMKKQISRQRKRQEQQQHPLPDPDRETYI